MKKPTQADYVKTALRLPPELHARVHDSAKARSRTYNAELIARLESSFSTEEAEAVLRITPDQLQDIIRVAVVQAIHLVESGATTGHGNPDLLEEAIKETKERVTHAVQGAHQAELDHGSDSHEYRTAQDLLRKMRARLNELEMQRMLIDYTDDEFTAEEKLALQKYAPKGKRHG